MRQLLSPGWPGKLWSIPEKWLDFGGVQRLDSAGLGELALVHMSASDQGKLVKLAGAKPHVRELLDLTNLSSVFKIYPTLEDAIEAGDEVATPV
jgi:anti-sigma B factor antagonist